MDIKNPHHFVDWLKGLAGHLRTDLEAGAKHLEDLASALLNELEQDARKTVDTITPLIEAGAEKIIGDVASAALKK